MHRVDVVVLDGDRQEDRREDQEARGDVEEGAKQEQQAESPQPEEKDAVRSPISGVFYLCKEPGAAPFVQVGSRVNKGDTLCIIEAMKTMNEIRAPKSSVIAGILAADGATIAAGDSLFLLREGN